MRRAIACLLASAAVLMAIFPAGATAGPKPAPIKHVFIIVLENEAYGTTFGDDTQIPYLARRLASRGALLTNYYATGHLSLDNYISMISGQAPNVLTQADCPVYVDVTPGLDTGRYGQVFGQGCVYPSGTITVANELEDSGFTWKGYMQDMNVPNAGGAPGAEVTCRHPALDSRDDTQGAEVGDQYAARHNPFVYFHSISDFPTCAENDIDFTHLSADLRHRATTANYSFITPNLCNDGHDSPCVDGQPGGLVQANSFLRSTVPGILGSPGFKDHGLLIVTFDESEDSDTSACCGERAGPNTPSPGGPSFGPGGGKVGAVLVSPCIRPGTVSDTPYNHYSMLRSVEDFFGLPYLGYSGTPGLTSFGRDIFTRIGDRSSRLGRCDR
jgi:hypothetical protein